METDMEQIVTMGLGAAVVVAALVMKYGASKTWAYVQAWFKSRATAAEKQLQAKVMEFVNAELATVKADIAAVKSKVGL